MIRIAILASGSGSNAEAIIKHFESIDDIEVALVMSNRSKAFVLQRAANHNIPARAFSRSEFESSEAFLAVLSRHEIDYIVLAGFLLLVPSFLIAAFPDRIINIHPALLPQYGGKGMYGMHVHQAVFDNKEAESGMTIHLVNEKYDEGKILFQDKVRLLPGDTPDVIAGRVLELEHRHYPVQIEKYIRNHSLGSSKLS